MGRGVATTATYEARALGVPSGMGLMKAAALAPEAILLPAHFEAYARVSRAFKAAVAEVAPLIEDRGIDEIYLDLTEVPGGSRELALRLKEAVRQATGLSCSIGITPNKLLSKMASELEKPDGMTILDRDDIPTRIWPLREAARTCLKRVTLDRRLRLLGIRAGSLVQEGVYRQQASEPSAVAEPGLFDSPGHHSTGENAQQACVLPAGLPES